MWITGSAGIFIAGIRGTLTRTLGQMEIRGCGTIGFKAMAGIRMRAT